MEAKIQISGKNITKVVGATCLATGVIALSSLVASGAAVAAVAEGLKTAKNMVKSVVESDDTADASPAEEKDAQAVPTHDREAETAERELEETE